MSSQVDVLAAVFDGAAKGDGLADVLRGDAAARHEGRIQRRRREVLVNTRDVGEIELATPRA